VPLFVATYTYVDDAAALDAARPEHRAFLGGLDELVLSGPTDAGGAVLVLEAGDAAAVERILDADPFRTAGLIAARAVTGWTVVLGRARDAVQPSS
jgi:hypothetical protein